MSAQAHVLFLRPVKETSERFREGIFVLNLAFPNDQGLPTECPQREHVGPIPCPVCLKFGLPKIEPSLGHASQFAALVAVPKATVNKDDFVAARKHNVGPPRQVAPVQPISVA
jgi:hypothetical protein